ncbi:MAG: MFS transporter [Pseudomonadales bacterium]|jgi:AAHS family 4-hydroxybenzoate transporter-like MFS transporter|nr:MFS transporter [Pseudomonadales bacterium]
MTSHSIDLQAFINERRLSRLQWLIIVLCFLILAIDGFDTAAIGFIAPALTLEWGIERPAIAPVLTAALVGLAFGALAAGPIADRIGRKPVLVTSVVLFGLGSLASALTNDLFSLTIVRFLTGLGLGAAMPNATTLTAEYVPDQRRAFLVTLMFCGYTLGSALGGFVAAWLIPAYGWRSVLLLGGAMPLVLALLLALFLPESAKFLISKGRPVARIRRILERMRAGPNVLNASAFTIPDSIADRAARPVSAILAPALLRGTLLLWTTYFFGLTIVFLLTSWMPTLLNQAGYSISRAAVVTAGFQGGGTIGAILVGQAMDRMRPSRALAISYFLAAIFVFLIGRSAEMVTFLTVTVIGAGFFTSGAQTPLNAFAAQFYPTELRATGVSWMLGVGRCGAILGTFIGGPLLAAGWGFPAIFGLLAVSGLIASLAIMLVGLIYSR